MLSPRFPDRSARWPAAAAALLWAVVAGTLLLWWLHMPRPAAVPDTLASLAQSSSQAQMRGGVERALGHTSTVAQAPEVQNRFVLLGVIAADSGRGSALIALDGQPAKVYVIGQTLDSGWHVDSVAARGATLYRQGQKLDLVLSGRD